MRLIDADTLGIREAEKEACEELIEHSNKYGNRSPQMYCYLQGRTDGLREASERVRFAPTIDAEKVRYGRWIQNNNKTWSCSECSSWIEDEQHHYASFCLCCGARMDGKEKHNAAD